MVFTELIRSSSVNSVFLYWDHGRQPWMERVHHVFDTSVSGWKEAGREGPSLWLAGQYPTKKAPQSKGVSGKRGQTAGDHCDKQVKWDLARLDSSHTSEFLVLTVPPVQYLSNTLSPQMVYRTFCVSRSLPALEIKNHVQTGEKKVKTINFIFKKKNSLQKKSSFLFYVFLIHEFLLFSFYTMKYVAYKFR